MAGQPRGQLVSPQRAVAHRESGADIMAEGILDEVLQTSAHVASFPQAAARITGAGLVQGSSGRQAGPGRRLCIKGGDGTGAAS